MADREVAMTQLAGILTFAMIAFGLLTSCNQPASTPESSGVVILQTE
jgi:hypothetical protein